MIGSWELLIESLLPPSRCLGTPIRQALLGKRCRCVNHSLHARTRFLNARTNASTSFPSTASNLSTLVPSSASERTVGEAPPRYVFSNPSHISLPARSTRTGNCPLLAVKFRPLWSDAGWFFQEEVARAARCVVRILNASLSWPHRLAAPTVRTAVVHVVRYRRHGWTNATRRSTYRLGGKPRGGTQVPAAAWIIASAAVFESADRRTAVHIQIRAGAAGRGYAGRGHSAAEDGVQCCSAVSAAAAIAAVRAGAAGACRVTRLAPKSFGEAHLAAASGPRAERAAASGAAAAEGHQRSGDHAVKR